MAEPTPEDDRISGSAYIVGSQMAEGYDPPSASLTAPLVTASDPTPEGVYRAAAEANDLVRPGRITVYTDVLAADPSFRAGVDAAYAAGREARDAGPCMDSSPRFFDCTPLLCELRAGHIGGHQSGTASWTKADEVERARSERDAYEAGIAAGREAERHLTEQMRAGRETWKTKALEFERLYHELKEARHAQ